MPLIRPIPVNPGNVLMKDTQGIVSSEAVCTSCHDGYVLDSRDSVGKHQSHTTFKKPSKNIRIPEMLTLSNRDELYCRTCHEPHICSKALKHAAPSGKPADPPAATNLEGDAASSFLRKPAPPGADLYIVCHEDSALLIGTDHDPFVTAPSAKNALGRSVSETGACGACHAVHNSTLKNKEMIEGLRPQ